MPKTRNVTRSEWAAATGSHATAPQSETTRRGRNENSKDEEKENTGRKSTRTRTHRRPGVLGATNTSVGQSIVSGKIATRGKPPPKGKGKALLSKEKKVPLQDITSQFLPAPEYTNRGEPSEPGETGSGAANQDSTDAQARAPSPISRQPALSPLPPSSPPSDFLASPPKRTEHPSAQTVDDLDYSPERAAVHFFDPWQELDGPAEAERCLSTPSRSDPFGFGAVEHKLKEDRELAAAGTPNHNLDVEGHDGEDEDLIDLPVADTSSPRPVRRLKRSHIEDPEDDTGHVLAPGGEFPISIAVTHFVTPPTPHKDKQKRRRLSHEGRDVFSPCESSVESSPSPTKIAPRRSDAHLSQDPLAEFNEELEKSCGPGDIVDRLPTSTRKPRASFKKEDVHRDAIARNLRPRRSSQPTVSPAKGRKRPKQTKGTKAKANKKPLSKSQPKPKASSNQSKDIEAKHQRELQQRIDYFKRLEDYHVETEDVFVI